MWRLGGKKTDFTIGENANFSWQHDFRRRRDGSYGMFDTAMGLHVEGGNVVVSVSWNGTTKVAKWRARAGGQPKELPATVEAPRAGFETTLTITGTPEYVVTEALDAGGKVLGTSSAIPVRV
jgi:hypothetical protein